MNTFVKILRWFEVDFYVVYMYNKRVSQHLNSPIYPPLHPFPKILLPHLTHTRTHRPVNTHTQVYYHIRPQNSNQPSLFLSCVKNSPFRLSSPLIFSLSHFICIICKWNFLFNLQLEHILWSEIFLINLLYCLLSFFIWEILLLVFKKYWLEWFFKQIDIFEFLSYF